MEDEKFAKGWKFKSGRQGGWGRQNDQGSAFVLGRFRAEWLNGCVPSYQYLLNSGRGGGGRR